MHPLVSVLMITHNHAPFITKSIESVLSQETSFEVELVIGEDASTDGTKEIIRKFSTRFPEKIFAVHHNENIGIGKNFFDTLSRCRGKYIALLDGDDRWINNKKLQIQADYLDRNPGVVACAGHTISESDQKGKGYRLIKWMKKLKRAAKEEFDREEMIVSNRFRTLTVMGRADAFKLNEKEIINSRVLDWPLFVNLTKNNVLKKYVNLPYRFGAYNVHGGGVFSSNTFRSKIKSSLEAREIITALTHGRYLGWHFPVCTIANPAKYNRDLLSLHYRKMLNDDPLLFSNEDIFVTTKKILERGQNLVVEFGYIFGALYQRAENFDNFTAYIIKMMRMVISSSLGSSEKGKLLRSTGSAWRDALFYAQPGLPVVWNFLLSPLKKYSGIYWYTVLLVYAGKLKR